MDNAEITTIHNIQSSNSTFECDPIKNIWCNKKRCHINGGDCWFTTNMNAAKSCVKGGDLITIYDKELEYWVNDLTKDLDRFIKNKPCWETFSATHVYIPIFGNIGNIYSLRFPGVTVGHIEVDNDMIVKEIILYEETCHHLKCAGINNRGKTITWNGVYERGIDRVVPPKYIGRKLVINEVLLH